MYHGSDVTVRIILDNNYLNRTLLIALLAIPNVTNCCPLIFSVWQNGYMREKSVNVMSLTDDAFEFQTLNSY